ncbi:MAG: Galactose 1-dehydrogenase, partial [Caulobacter sp.]|nr:Galactose 1-dehydrogenase [Caulobacter sp.]
ALSIATRILPKAFFLTEATLHFPENRQAPIAAELSFVDSDGVPIAAVFDFLQTGPQSWDIEVDTDGGQMVLSHGGARMQVDGALVHEGPVAEYERLYERFGQLIADGASDVDVSPLRHVADAFLSGRRVATAPFVE